MDIIDLKILDILKENGRISYNNISKSVQKTEATVRRRVKRLVDEGIIKKFTIEYQIDLKQKLYATIKIEPDFKEIKRILKELINIKEISNIWRLSGDCGLLLKVDVESIEKFNPLIEDKISQITGIKIIETCFITDIIK
ncbi:MAG: Lrp/AsnC family transcriptional regulator [Candidatus Lokiarchaeota archaeon]|nr:Lrp/AsnC family transcriptional regulator [Candidatus Lokiarchaeota archaeon]